MTVLTSATPGLSWGRIFGLIGVTLIAIVGWISLRYWPAMAAALLSMGMAVAPLFHREIREANIKWVPGEMADLQMWTKRLAVASGIAAIVLYLVGMSTTPEGRAMRERAAEERRLEDAREAREERLEQGRKKLEERAAQAAKLEQKRKGMHCLNDIDGSHWDMESEVKQRLRNPDSFDVIETAITRVDDKGNHQIIMTYRAQNGFGGMNVERAIGTVDSATCSLQNLRM